MEERTETKVNKLVGRKNGEYYSLEYVFKCSNDFQGAVGSVFRPISIAEVKNRMSLDNAMEYLEESWQAAVESKQTTQGLERFTRDVINNGVEGFFDLSPYEISEKIAEIHNKENNLEDDEKAEFCECVGRGRCFSKGMKFDHIYDPEVIKLIDQYEAI